jgi:hypothetical protein
VALAGVRSNRAKNQASPRWLIVTVFKSALTSCMIVFNASLAAYSQPAPNTTTHAHVCINCHSAVGADKRRCTSWFLLIERASS